MKKGKRAQIKVDPEHLGEIFQQLLLCAKAISRLIKLDSSNALSLDQKEKLYALHAFPESDVSGDVIRTMLREKANSAEGLLHLVRKKRKR